MTRAYTHRILIAVTGSIAAYKIPSVVNVLVDQNCEVRVMMTKAAKQFITPLTLSVLSHNPVYTEDTRFANDGHIHHIELADWADLIVIAPATYNTISKILQNRADNLVTSVIAAYTNKVLIFPAMNVNMWKNLKIHPSKDYINSDGPEFQWRVVAPGEGKLACGAIGPAKLLSTKEIIKYIMEDLDNG